MNADPTAPAATVDEALDACIRRAEADDIGLEETLETLGPASFCFVCLLLAVPFLQPVPLGPYTMAGAATFIACGWQMSQGREVPLLPKVMRDLRLHGRGWVATLRLCRKVLQLGRKICRPRREAWVTGKSGERLIGWLILTGGALLAVPMAQLPLNNFFPALMIAFAALAWLERDGLMVLASLAAGVLSVAYFVGVFVLLWLFGTQIFGWVKHLWP